MNITSATHTAFDRVYIIQLWLKTCLSLLLFMVLIGGLTRLTESGLSIVEWKLVTGILPPLTDAGWQEEFAAYKQTPEFIKKNAYMDVADFKRIFWLEYLHRLLGRMIGLAFLLPLIVFTVKRNVLSRQTARLMWGVTLLIGVQGGVGWYMVQSGLVHDPWVSPYRLAFHLLLATLICALTYTALRREQSNEVRYRHADRSGLVVLGLIAVQIMFGAFVAGMDAGLVYNTFPLMGGQFLPPDQWQLAPWYKNIVGDVATVQFIHRWFAFIVYAAILWQYVTYRHRISGIVFAIATVQLMLGIATLLTGVQIALASVHQLVAIILVLAQTEHLLRAKNNYYFSDKFGINNA